MATATLTKPAAKGGSFLLETPQPSDVFTPADLTDDQKLIGQTAEEFVVQEVLPVVKELENKKPGLMPELVKKGRSRPDGRRRAGRIRRRGPGQNFHYGPYGKAFDLRRIRGDARGARGHRNAADRLFRDGSAEEEIFAEARHR